MLRGIGLWLLGVPIWLIIIILLFVHAGLSFYVFGRVPFRRTLRVFHIYFGYALLVLVLGVVFVFGLGQFDTEIVGT